MNTVADIKARHSIASVLASHGIEVKGGMACCPFHDDENPSLSVKGEHWKCFAGCGSGDVIELLAKFEGKTSVEYLRSGNRTTPSHESKRLMSNPGASNLGEPTAVYHYRDETGKEVYQVRRYEPKDFRPYLPDAVSPGLKNVVRVPYRLPEILAAETVWIVEGEKDADNLAALGIAATCRAGGSSSWEPELTPWFKGKDIVICGDNDEPGKRYVDLVEAALKPFAKSIRRIEVPAPAKDITDYLGEMEDGAAHDAIKALLHAPDPLDLLLDARRFDLANPPAKPVPVLSINDKTIATAGNVVGITSQAKAGTTALQGAMLAALMDPTGDCLGITGRNPDGLAVIHFDTEQSEYDHHEVIRQSLARAGRAEVPAWLRSYHLADVPTKDRRKALTHEMSRAAIGGKIRAVFLDGVADLCHDPNDAAEAFALIEELHRLAITYDCPILCRLHENPGTETGKTRGHLGSQLERKAETNLRLTKDADGVTSVFTERSRHCHIPKESGPRFAWDDGAMMHLSCGTKQAQRSDATAQRHHETAVGIFGNDPAKSMSWAELIAALEPIAGTKKAAEHRVEAMKKYRAIRYEFGRYRLRAQRPRPAPMTAMRRLRRQGRPAQPWRACWAQGSTSQAGEPRLRPAGRFAGPRHGRAWIGRSDRTYGESIAFHREQSNRRGPDSEIA